MSWDHTLGQHKELLAYISDTVAVFPAHLEGCQEDLAHFEIRLTAEFWYGDETGFSTLLESNKFA